MQAVSFIDQFNYILTLINVSTTESLYDMTNKDGEVSLYLAVILQALLDVTKPKVKDESKDTK